MKEKGALNEGGKEETLAEIIDRDVRLSTEGNPDPELAERIGTCHIMLFIAEHDKLDNAELLKKLEEGGVNLPSDDIVQARRYVDRRIGTVGFMRTMEDLWKGCHPHYNTKNIGHNPRGYIGTSALYARNSGQQPRIEDL